MEPVFDANAPKPINPSINSDLLKRVKSLNINLLKDFKK
jgi:hypothetical protein